MSEHHLFWAAQIDEQACIGCTLCLKACPVDAIIGAAHQMHTVLTQECTGCRLCVAPCPVDCIRMVTVPELTHEQRKLRAQTARRRVKARQLRQQQKQRSPLLQTAAERKEELTILLAQARIQKKHEPS